MIRNWWVLIRDAQFGSEREPSTLGHVIAGPRRWGKYEGVVNQTKETVCGQWPLTMSCWGWSIKKTRNRWLEIDGYWSEMHSWVRSWSPQQLVSYHWSRDFIQWNLSSELLRPETPFCIFSDLRDPYLMWYLICYWKDKVHSNSYCSKANLQHRDDVNTIFGKNFICSRSSVCQVKDRLKKHKNAVTKEKSTNPN